jgi:hypothetical protein
MRNRHRFVLCETFYFPYKISFTGVQESPERVTILPSEFS